MTEKLEPLLMFVDCYNISDCVYFVMLTKGVKIHCYMKPK